MDTNMDKYSGLNKMIQFNQLWQRKAKPLSVPTGSSGLPSDPRTSLVQGPSKEAGVKDLIRKLLYKAPQALGEAPQATRLNRGLSIVGRYGLPPAVTAAGIQSSGGFTPTETQVTGPDGKVHTETENPLKYTGRLMLSAAGGALAEPMAWLGAAKAMKGSPTPWGSFAHSILPSIKLKAGVAGLSLVPSLVGGVQDAAANMSSATSSLPDITKGLAGASKNIETTTGHLPALGKALANVGGSFDQISKGMADRAKADASVPTIERSLSRIGNAAEAFPWILGGLGITGAGLLGLSMYSKRKPKPPSGGGGSGSGPSSPKGPGTKRKSVRIDPGDYEVSLRNLQVGDPQAKQSDYLSSMGGPPLPSGDLSPYFSEYASLNPSAALDTVISDPTLSPTQRALGMTIVRKAAMDSPGYGFTTGDLVRAGVSAGLGYGAAALTGKVLGAVFGLNPASQRTLANVGAVGGLLRGTGIWK